MEVTKIIYLGFTLLITYVSVFRTIWAQISARDVIMNSREMRKFSPEGPYFFSVSFTPTHLRVSQVPELISFLTFFTMSDSLPSSPVNIN